MSKQIVELIDKADAQEGQMFHKGDYMMWFKGDVLHLTHYGTEILNYTAPQDLINGVYSQSRSDTESINTVLDEYMSIYRVKTVKGQVQVYEAYEVKYSQQAGQNVLEPKK